jgi:S-formylglutathione hydrolase FrmB
MRVTVADHIGAGTGERAPAGAGARCAPRTKSCLLRAVVQSYADRADVGSMGAVAARSTSNWLEGSPDWAWPGLKPAVELGPAAWVPALPVRIELPAARVAVRPRPRTLPRPLRLARLALLVALAAGTFVVSSGIAQSGPAVFVSFAPVRLDAALASPFASPATLLADAVDHVTPAFAVLAPALPAPVTISTDSAGATIASITYSSAALGWRDRYLVYLPPGYAASATRRYPVLYLLHGEDQPASSFLRLGVAPTLDRLIATHQVRPLIAVMLQGAPAPQNWLNTTGPRFYSYVAEVQRLTDRVLRTIPSRSARAIAGYSMGGFGAMNVALEQLRNYSVVESWEGQFANLSGELTADRPLLRRLPLHAFVWGGAEDTVVNTSLDAPWAAAMRAAGAQAQSAVYPGAHAFAPIERHLAQMLSFAGRQLAN